LLVGFYLHRASKHAAEPFVTRITLCATMPDHDAILIWKFDWWFEVTQPLVPGRLLRERQWYDAQEIAFGDNVDQRQKGWHIESNLPFRLVLGEHTVNHTFGQQRLCAASERQYGVSFLQVSVQRKFIADPWVVGSDDAA
jgi:hypothetical protein